MNLQKYIKKVTWVHAVALVAILLGLWQLGLLQAFFGAVVADIEVETATCRIAGEIWSPDTLKCQCPAGYGYEFGPSEKGGQGWKCVSLAAVPTAAEIKPASAPVEEPFLGPKNIMLGLALIIGAIAFAFIMRGRK